MLTICNFANDFAIMVSSKQTHWKGTDLEAGRQTGREGKRENENHPFERKRMAGNQLYCTTQFREQHSHGRYATEAARLGTLRLFYDARKRLETEHVYGHELSGLNKEWKLPSIKITTVGAGEMSLARMARNTWCSCRGPGFGSHHPHGGSQPSLSLVPRNPITSDFQRSH